MAAARRDRRTAILGAVTTRRRLGGTAVVGATLGLSGFARVAGQAATPVSVQQTQDVVYGEIEGTPLLLDVFQPSARETPRPAVIIIHGGGFVGGDRRIGWEAATHMAEVGYVAFTIGYRLFDQTDGANPWPAQLDDAQRAVRWVRADAVTYGVDPERIGAYGHSSGGTLAEMLGVRETRDDSDPTLAGISSRVTCVVALAGSSDLSIPPPAVMATCEERLNAGLFGGTLEEVPEVYQDASPISHIGEERAPFLVIHGAEDADVPVEHSRRLVEALHEAGVEVAYLDLPDANHDLPAWWMISGPWALTFLGVPLHPER